MGSEGETKRRRQRAKGVETRIQMLEAATNGGEKLGMVIGTLKLHMKAEGGVIADGKKQSE